MLIPYSKAKAIVRHYNKFGGGKVEKQVSYKWAVYVNRNGFDGRIPNDSYKLLTALFSQAELRRLNKTGVLHDDDLEAINSKASNIKEGIVCLAIGFYTGVRFGAVRVTETYDAVSFFEGHVQMEISNLLSDFFNNRKITYAEKESIRKLPLEQKREEVARLIINNEEWLRNEFSNWYFMK